MAFTDKFLNSKAISILSFSVCIYLTSIVSAAWVTKHAITGGQRFSTTIRSVILSVANFPSRVKSVIGLIENYFPPQGKAYLYKNQQEILPKTETVGGYVLVPYINSIGINQLLLINLSTRNRKLIDIPPNKKPKTYNDVLVGSEQNRQGGLSSRNRIWNPYLTKDGTLVYAIPWNDLISVNLNTKTEEWRIRGAFHHSIEPDFNGDIWVCGAARPGSMSTARSKTRQSNTFFADQVLVHVSKNGRILKSISVADLLVNSGLEYLLYGVSNPDTNFDPIHLNQITPIKRDAGLFRKGQILVSLRNLSTILLVDPITEKILWYRCGPWMNQHCVAPMGDSTISVLDNHSFASGEYWLNEAWNTKIIQHEIGAGKFTNVQIKSGDENFRIPIEGRASLISPQTWMIEDSLQGTIMIFQNKQLVFKWSNLYPDGTIGFTSWSRYIAKEDLPIEFQENSEMSQKGDVK